MNTKKSFLVWLTILFAVNLQAQEWEPLGPDEFAQASVQEVNYLSHAINSEGVPFIAYSDRSVNSKITVKQWTGTEWVFVGSQGFSVDIARQVKLAIDKNNNLYVAYGDYSLSDKLTVQKFDANTNEWINIGEPGFSSGRVSSLNIVVDPVSNYPCVAYTVPDINSLEAIPPSLASVKKWDGDSWENIGDEYITSYPTGHLFFAFDPSGIPYVAYTSQKGFVKKWVGGAWQEVGSNGFSDGGALHISLSFKTDGTPFIAFKDLNSNAGQNGPTLKSWNGESWESENRTGLAFGQASDITLIIDNSNNFFIAYKILQGVVQGEAIYKALVEKLVDGAWVDLGTDVFSELSISSLSLALDPSSIPIIAFKDEALQGKAVVKKWDETSWANLGTTGISNGLASYITLALDPDEIPYVGFSEGIKGKATVKKWNQSEWAYVGAPGFSEGRAGFCYIVIDPETKQPIMAYSDGGVDGKDGKTTVKQFNGTSWVVLGTRGFSTGQAYNISMALDANGALYIAYSDVGLDRKLVVKKWNNPNWEDVGSEGISAGLAGNPSLAIGPDDVPYVGYFDQDNGEKATVKKWNNSGWVDLGTPGLSAGACRGTVLAFNPSGTPFIAYNDNVNTGPTVKKWNNQSGDWVTVGEEGFSYEIPQKISLAFSPTGAPFISYITVPFGRAYIKSWNQQTKVWEDVSEERLTVSNIKDLDITVNSQGYLLAAYTSPANAKQLEVGLGCNPPIPDVQTLPDIEEECESIPVAPTATNSCGDIFTATSNVEFPIRAQGTTIVTWTYDDGNENVVTQTQNVIIADVTDPIPDIQSLEDITAECEVTELSPPTATDNCAGVIYGTTEASLPIIKQGTTIVTWTYDDGNENVVTQTQNVIIDDVTDPVPDIDVLVNISAECAVAELLLPTATDNCAGLIYGTTDASLPITNQGTTIVTWTYDDKNGQEVTQTQNVIITNTDPDIRFLSVPESPLPVNSDIRIIAEADDNIVSSTWDWGDGTPHEVVNVSGLTNNHVYSEAGVYTISLSVTDRCGENDSRQYEYVVIYDPSGGFVTGGGWINSPAGASLHYPEAVGKANFGFVSKYRKGSTVPTGNTEFQFKAGNLNFNSNLYEWLVIAGSKAMFKGAGTINGMGDYGFLLSAIDSDLTPSTHTDKFRIKIWDKSEGDIVYDNLIDAPDDADPTSELGGGSIVIHSGKAQMKSASVIQPEAKINIYPNPFDNSIYLDLFTESAHDIIIDMVDMNGRVVEYLYSGIVAEKVEHHYEFNITLDLIPGYYMLRIRNVDGESLGRKMILKQ